MVLHAYIAREFLTPSFIGFLLFTSVFLSDKILRLLDLLLTQGVPFHTIAKLYVLSLPSFLPITIPLSFLVGLTVGFARFSADGEYMAMRVSGRPYRSLLLAPAVFAVAFYLLTLYISLYAQPQASSAFKDLLRETAERQIEAALKERVFFDDFENLLVYVQKVSKDRRTFEGVFVGDRGEGRDITVVARSGVMSDPTQEAGEGEQEARKLVLLDGVSLARDKGGDRLTVVNFERYELPLRYVKKSFVRPLPDPRDLTYRELRSEIERREAEAGESKDLFAYQIEFHRKWALPFSCLVFLLVGPALVSVPRGSGALRGYWVCLALAFVYYLLLTAATRMGERGLITPVMVAWVPNALLLATGAVLFARRERQGV
ncbi:MAG: LptF/LptG family permease [Nitrospirae bacterium]|nr:LptF/LptG family permease [Nitrospirota bacterium]